MAKKENQKIISVILDKDMVDELHNIAKNEGKSVSKFCSFIIEGIVNNPDVLAALKFKAAQQQLSISFDRYTEYHPHGDADIKRLVQQFEADLISINRKDDGENN